MHYCAVGVAVQFVSSHHSNREIGLMIDGVQTAVTVKDTLAITGALHPYRFHNVIVPKPHD